VQASGTTAVVFMRNHLKDPEVFWSAHCGDSRLVVGTEAKRAVEFVTADHKPDTPAERERIEASGGEVRSFTYDDDWTVHRIFVKDADYPGLCMARSLGDHCVKTHGVTCEPEVHRHTLPDRKSKPLIIMASDGVWEFLASDWVMKAIARKVPVDGASRCIQKLAKEARKRRTSVPWKEGDAELEWLLGAIRQLPPPVWDAELAAHGPNKIVVEEIMKKIREEAIRLYKRAIEEKSFQSVVNELEGYKAAKRGENKDEVPSTNLPNEAISGVLEGYKMESLSNLVDMMKLRKPHFGFAKLEGDLTHVDDRCQTDEPARIAECGAPTLEHHTAAIRIQSHIRGFLQRRMLLTMKSPASELSVDANDGFLVDLGTCAASDRANVGGCPSSYPDNVMGVVEEPQASSTSQNVEDSGVGVVEPEGMITESHRKAIDNSLGDCLHHEKNGRARECDGHWRSGDGAAEFVNEILRASVDAAIRDDESCEDILSGRGPSNTSHNVERPTGHGSSGDFITARVNVGSEYTSGNEPVGPCDADAETLRSSMSLTAPHQVEEQYEDTIGVTEDAEYDDEELCEDHIPTEGSVGRVSSAETAVRKPGPIFECSSNIDSAAGCRGESTPMEDSQCPLDHGTDALGQVLSSERFPHDPVDTGEKLPTHSTASLGLETDELSVRAGNRSNAKPRLPADAASCLEDRQQNGSAPPIAAFDKSGVCRAPHIDEVDSDDSAIRSKLSGLQEHPEGTATLEDTHTIAEPASVQAIGDEFTHQHFMECEGHKANLGASQENCGPDAHWEANEEPQLKRRSVNSSSSAPPISDLRSNHAVPSASLDDTGQILDELLEAMPENAIAFHENALETVDSPDDGLRQERDEPLNVGLVSVAYECKSRACNNESPCGNGQYAIVDTRSVSIPQESAMVHKASVSGRPHSSGSPVGFATGETESQDQFVDGLEVRELGSDCFEGLVRTDPGGPNDNESKARGELSYNKGLGEIVPGNGLIHALSQETMHGEEPPETQPAVESNSAKAADGEEYAIGENMPNEDHACLLEAAASKGVVEGGESNSRRSEVQIDSLPMPLPSGPHTCLSEQAMRSISGNGDQLVEGPDEVREHVDGALFDVKGNSERGAKCDLEFAMVQRGLEGAGLGEAAVTEASRGARVSECPGVLDSIELDREELLHLPDKSSGMQYGGYRATDDESKGRLADSRPVVENIVHERLAYNPHAAEVHPVYTDKDGTIDEDENLALLGQARCSGYVSLKRTGDLPMGSLAVLMPRPSEKGRLGAAQMTGDTLSPTRPCTQAEHVPGSEDGQARRAESPDIAGSPVLIEQDGKQRLRPRAAIPSRTQGCELTVEEEEEVRGGRSPKLWAKLVATEGTGLDEAEQKQILHELDMERACRLKLKQEKQKRRDEVNKERERERKRLQEEKENQLIAEQEQRRQRRVEELKLWLETKEAENRERRARERAQIQALKDAKRAKEERELQRQEIFNKEREARLRRAARRLEKQRIRLERAQQDGSTGHGSPLTMLTSSAPVLPEADGLLLPDLEIRQVHHHVHYHHGLDLENSILSDDEKTRIE
ncbi:hypothetical protein FOL47_009199, partial [Perkinsus chesapeaki]